MSAEGKANLRSSYAEILHRFGMTPNGNLNNLMNQGVSNQWSSTAFIQHLRQTAEYKKQFVGIQWKDGMSESEYIRTYDSMKEQAQNLGFKLSREQFGHLIRGGTTLKEFAVRVADLKMVQNNRAMLEQFGEELRTRGLIKPNADWNLKDMYKFVTGSSDKRFETVWNMAYTQTQLEGAGVTIGPGGDLTRKDVGQIIRGFEGAGVSPVQPQVWSEITNQLLTAYPLSQLQGMGLSKKDIVTAVAGGPGSTEIRAQIQSIMATERAFIEAKPTGPIEGFKEAAQG